MGSSPDGAPRQVAARWKEEHGAAAADRPGDSLTVAAAPVLVHTATERPDMHLTLSHAAHSAIARRAAMCAQPQRAGLRISAHDATPPGFRSHD